MDDDKLALFALRVWDYKQGEVVALMIYLGTELGLYAAMAGAGPLGADELARRAGLQPRWVLEWLRCQGAAGLVETADGETFELSDEAAEVLVNEAGSVWYAAGAFSGRAVEPAIAERLLTSFRTGRGLTYEELGRSGATAIERLTAPWTRQVVPRILPVLDGVVEKLREGADVADVGCGGGVALIEMATAFPSSRFHGYDPSAAAVELAREKAAERLTNVELHVAAADALPDAPCFDLVLTLDCLHDMPQPAMAAAAIHRCLRADGTWLIKDIRCSPNWSDNIKNPVLALMYGTSVTACMSSGLSEPGGLGLGTLGLHPALAEQLCRDAGFTRFAVHDLDDPANLYYEVRP
jgi:2-polyprenyl-3-methyl-5-hydroxy-6-metoxy-1,4-benzoquinol methylase